jgi:hypothetical protein
VGFIAGLVPDDLDQDGTGARFIGMAGDEPGDDHAGLPRVWPEPPVPSFWPQGARFCEGKCAAGTLIILILVKPLPLLWPIIFE